MASGILDDDDPRIYDDPNITIDEYILLESLGRKASRGYDAQRDNAIREQNDIDTYRENLKYGNEKIPGAYDLSDPAEARALRDSARNDQDGSGRKGGTPQASRFAEQNPSGGFAVLPILGAVAPFVPLISQGINSVIGLISGLINKKKGSGVFAPNLQFGRGPLKLALGRAMKARAGDHERIDRALNTMQGSKFWHTFLSETKNEIRGLLPTIANVSPAQSGRIAQMALDRAFSPRFQQQVAKQAAQASEELTQGRGVPSDNSRIQSLVVPMVKFITSEIVENTTDDKHVDDLIRHETNEVLGGKVFGPKFKEKAKSFFSKLFKYSKKITKKVVPSLIQVAREELPELVSQGAKKLKGFNIPPAIVDALADETRKQGNALVSKLSDKIQLSLADQQEGSGRRLSNRDFAPRKTRNPKGRGPGSKSFNISANKKKFHVKVI